LAARSRGCAQSWPPAGQQPDAHNQHAVTVHHHLPLF
jgi:hypothetical protein